MIDIHSHILPGLDDGAESLDESLAMAEMAVRSGVKIITATPHSNQEDLFQNYESMEMKSVFQELREALVKEKIPLKLARGMEIFASNDIVTKIEEGLLISLNGSRYYLIEFSFNEDPKWIEWILQNVLESGKIPVIAHPERYYCVQDTPEYLFYWRRIGALAQLNKGSILGRFGPRTERAAQILLKHQLVNCIASDAHKPYIRTTNMEEIDHFLQDYFSVEYRNLLLEKNPYRILTNRFMPEDPPPIPFEKKKRWLW